MTMSVRSYIRRSLPMLGRSGARSRASIVLGLAVTALPFVSNAAFGPLMQAVADAGIDGNLSSVWGLDGSMLGRGDGAAAGLIGWLATPLPFAVLLTIWAARWCAAQVLGFLKSWIDAQVEWKLLTVDPPARPRSHPVAVAGFLHGRAHRRADAAGAVGSRRRSAAADRMRDPAVGRCGGVAGGAGLSGGTVVADDDRIAGPVAVGVGRACGSPAGVFRRRRDG